MVKVFREFGAPEDEQDKEGHPREADFQPGLRLSRTFDQKRGVVERIERQFS